MQSPSKWRQKRSELSTVDSYLHSTRKAIFYLSFSLFKNIYITQAYRIFERESLRMLRLFIRSSLSLLRSLSHTSNIKYWANQVFFFFYFSSFLILDFILKHFLCVIHKSWFSYILADEKDVSILDFYLLLLPFTLVLNYWDTCWRTGLKFTKIC